LQLSPFFADGVTGKYSEKRRATPSSEASYNKAEARKLDDKRQNGQIRSSLAQLSSWWSL
jgi:hypothetical protein